MYRIFSIGLFLLLASFFVSPVSAHVVVKPNEVGIATFQTFTVGVPVEKEFPTTSLRLVIPEGLHYVTPNVKPGWFIETKTIGEAEERKVTEIIWSGGEIPVGQRDEFLFSAQVPAQEKTIPWKAYQTYADGEVVAWDADPKTIEEHPADSEGDEEHETAHPYSETKVVNDLKTPSKTAAIPTTTNNAFLIAIAALALSAFSLALQFRR